MVVLGRDGLPIDAVSRNGADVEGLAALVPSLFDACTKLGDAGARGAFSAGVMEYGGGFVVVSVVAPDALMAVVVQSGTNVGSLLYEFRRYRSAIAELF